MAFDRGDTVVVREDHKSTRRLYRTTCDDCGADRGYQRISRAKRPYCRSCASRRAHAGKRVSDETRKRMSESSWIRRNPDKHPFLGRTHDEATRKLLSDKQRAYSRRYGNQFLTGRSKGKHSKDTIARISAANSNKQPRWKGRTFVYDGPHGRIMMRSSYELAYAGWLDEQGISWTYEPRFKLSDGRIFSPDFQLDSGVIIEVKGYWTKRGREKWLRFCNDYPYLEKRVVTKDDLKKIGLL